MTTVSGTGSTNSTTSTSSSASTSIGASQKDFLKLITAELQNQDPTDPTSTSSYYSTLAQFYSVDAQTSANTKLDTIISLLKAQASATSGTSNTGSNTNVSA